VNHIEQVISGLVLPAPLEEEFRKHYSQSGVIRARLMPCFALMMTLIGVVLRLSGDEPQLLMMIWDLGFFAPLLIATLYMSTLPDHYRAYQVLLAISGLISGLVIVSIYFRPVLVGMPSYLAMEVVWIVVVWFLWGLRFWRAACVALLITSAHIYGILTLNYEVQVLGYEIVMLLLVNGIGAVSCYQLESTARRSFVESQELVDMARELSKLAELDGLTGLNNRRSYDSYIDRIWRQAKREEAVLTIMLVDIDHFKAYNDRYGHQSGDDTLKAVANVIAAHAKRPLDFTARYGGEEFVLALYDSSADSNLYPEDEAARKYAETLRKGIAAIQIPHEDSTTGKYLTVSIGVAVILPGARRSLAGAVQMADEALYQAKEEGRNRVVVIKTGDSNFRTGRFRARKPSVA
jgi:diguanylate cyclase (GGDEF)-like protein